MCAHHQRKPTLHSLALQNTDVFDGDSVKETSTGDYALELLGEQRSRQRLPRVEAKPALQPTQWLHIADKSTRHSGEAGPAFRNKGQLVLQGQPALSAGGGHTGKGEMS